MDSSHGSGGNYMERMYYHNTILCGQDQNTNSGATNAIAWNSPTRHAGYPGEQYNNIICQAENTSFMGRQHATGMEQDYQCFWCNPTGFYAPAEGFGNSTRLKPRRANNTEVGYASWAAFEDSGAHYNETKHATGDGPGSPDGWNANGIFADPEFVNGGNKIIVSGDLTTCFPAVGGNLNFAVDLTSTGWPGAGSEGYVGAYQPGDPITKVGPEQGLWVD